MLFYPKTSGYIEIADIDDWYSTCQKSLEAMERAYLAWMNNGAFGVPPINLPKRVTSQSEVKKYFDDSSKELELTGILWLVTSLEGRFRIDLRKRYGDTDFLGAKLTALRNSKAEEFLVPFEAGILDVWKDFLRNGKAIQNSLANVCVNAYGEIKPLIRLRNWLAHGRYFEAKVNPASFDISAARNAIDKLFSNCLLATQQAGITAIT